MNIFQNMIELYNHLSPGSTYRFALKGILMHLGEACDASIYELADLTSSSRTTIWRMLQMLGYENYSDFRSALRQAIRNYTYYNRVIGDRTDGAEQMIGRMAGQLEMTARNVKERLSVPELSAMAKQISGKDQVFFFFPYRSAAIYSFQQNLSMAGVGTHLACLLPEMLECAYQAGERSFVFCSTIEYAETMDMTELFRLLREKKAEIALFAAGDSRYDRYVDYTLCKREKHDGVLSSLLFYDMYIYALSEIFRNNYL